MKKAIIIILIIFSSLVVIVYGGVFLGHKVIFPLKRSNVPTIPVLTDGNFTFGPQAHLTQPQNIDEYIRLLAQQIKLYNEIAPDLWPGNALVNQSAVVEEITSKKFFHIEADGKITPLTKSEALKFGFNRVAYTGGFSFYDSGVYLAVDKNEMTNFLMWQKYLHLGTYDSILFLTHEGFHAKEQVKWQKQINVHNREREEYDSDISARAKRHVLQKQLLKAVSQPGSTALILEALSTYADWKKQFRDDYINSTFFDRIEGTAFYFELITGLYIGYPDQIKNENDIDRALALLATREDVYLSYGLISESYTVGGFACALLERLNFNWKEQLINDPDATPVEMLLQYFTNETLPEPRQVTQEEIDEVSININAPTENRGLPLFMKFLYDLLF
ncbi:MAG: hypothetical protein LBG94_01490 [Treponema sp.]|nr:hypothetical protein [Treponema sp.]